MAKELNASEFKATCLAVLDEVQATGESVTILKRGRPVAKLVPATESAAVSPQASLRGCITFVGDILAPVLPAEAWEVNS